jgi:hypothetical protein
MIDTRFHGRRVIGNVNRDSNWSNYSSHRIGINLLKHFGASIRADEITTLSLNASLFGSSAFQTADN